MATSSSAMDTPLQTWNDVDGNTMRNFLEVPVDSFDAISSDNENHIVNNNRKRLRSTTNESLLCPGKDEQEFFKRRRQPLSLQQTAGVSCMSNPHCNDDLGSLRRLSLLGAQYGMEQNHPEASNSIDISYGMPVTDNGDSIYLPSIYGPSSFSRNYDNDLENCVHSSINTLPIVCDYALCQNTYPLINPFPWDLEPTPITFQEFKIDHARSA